jgi:hypothetical protein
MPAQSPAFINAGAGTTARPPDRVRSAWSYGSPFTRERTGCVRWITGLADALVMLGLGYDDPRGRAFAADTMRQIRDLAYETSIELAREKGAFPAFDAVCHLQSEFVNRLLPRLRRAIGAGGIRNSHLLAIAPCGAVSLLAGNVSSGIEPVFAFEYVRTARAALPVSAGPGCTACLPLPAAAAGSGPRF